MTVLGIQDTGHDSVNGQRRDGVRSPLARGASVVLCTGPLYHAAPLGFTMSFLRVGATVVVQALRIMRWCTVCQVLPTLASSP